MELPENTDLKKHAIDLGEGKQPPYKAIYALTLVKLETLKAYIKTHLKTGSIWSFKFLASTLIIFDKKNDGSLYLFMNYWG